MTVVKNLPGGDEHLDPTVSRINEALNVVCRPEGFTRREFEELVGFELKYRREDKSGWSRLRLPERFRFINLNTSVRVSDDNKEFVFSLGLGRTPLDPTKGRITNYWVHDNPDGAIFSTDVTGFGSFQLCEWREPFLRLRTLQATAILAEDNDLVMEELKGMKDEHVPGAGSLANRMETHRLWCVPWAYAQRLMVFAPLSIHFARLFGVDTIRVSPEITEESRPSINYERFRYMAERLPHEGIRIIGPP